MVWSTNMNPVFRLSRIDAPRATLWSVLLLIVALGVFGTWAHVLHPAPAAEAMTTASSELSLDDLIRVAVRW